MGWQVIQQAIVPDELEVIRQFLVDWSDNGKLDVLFTTGGTGFAPRDITPEATLEVVNRLAPGLVEAMRAFGLQKTPHAMLSRAVAGIRQTTIIVNFPGSPRAALENLDLIASVLPHAVSLLQESSAAEAGHLYTDEDLGSAESDRVG
jgi:molybdenum cofactor synthesis domain-containing protein